ncbi:hypothetical protein E2C01_094056 [Portunus trituberculatus]|uniref:Uncharacterized protein n=1 Tax=Portunus trituberculatus TaxID=210409 RepID=A0A5B7JVX1_PORTR|nr:hypothetical protein [Portunus trituberculatus]
MRTHRDVHEYTTGDEIGQVMEERPTC